MKTLTNVLTEKGKLKAAVAKDLKAQCSAHLTSLGFELMPNGKYAMEIADADGHTVTMNLEMTVGLDTCFDKKEKTVKAKAEKEPVDLGDLFA